MSETTNSQRTLTAQSYSAYKQYLVQKLQQQGGFDLFDRKMTHLLIEQAIQKSGVSVNGSLREQLVQEVFEEVFGLGPVQPFLEDPQVTEIMINGAKRVYSGKKGLIYKTDVSFAKTSK